MGGSSGKVRPTGTLGLRVIRAKVPCHFCQQPTDADDSMCHGCGKAICDTCDVDPQMGSHEPDDHLGLHWD